MKSSEHHPVYKFIEKHSLVQYFPLDNLLSKLDNQNLIDLKKILDDVYETGKADCAKCWAVEV